MQSNTVATQLLQGVRVSSECEGESGEGSWSRAQVPVKMNRDKDSGEKVHKGKTLSSRCRPVVNFTEDSLWL